jgi:hypothetical protein
VHSLPVPLSALVSAHYGEQHLQIRTKIVSEQKDSGSCRNCCCPDSLAEFAGSQEEQLSKFTRGGDGIIMKDEVPTNVLRLPMIFLGKKLGIFKPIKSFLP